VSIWIGIIVLTLAAASWWLLQVFETRRQVRARWYAEEPATATPLGASIPRGWLSQWLYVAGYRAESAAAVFVIATLCCVGLGFGSAIAMRISGAQAAMEVNVVLIPGGVGETFLPVVWAGPWIVAIILASTPWLIVRSTRRRRVEAMEQDLPLAMELLAALSEAGLGFDSALARIQKTRLAGRPLASEFRMFQSDLLAGRPRVESLRRLSSRTSIGSISILVSALVQAEHLGMGIAAVLRSQANEIRARRRERAIAFANALPVKRLFPLVICFLPGLFVWTLGPAFVQLFKMTDTFTRGSGF